MTSPMTLNRHIIDSYVIIASLKSEPMGKLIDRTPGSHLLIPSLPGSALITHVESLGLLGLAMATSVLKALPGKRHSPGILFLRCHMVQNYQTSRYPA